MVVTLGPQHSIMSRRSPPVCLCVFFPLVLDIKFVERTSPATQEEGHTGFLIHLSSAVRALSFLAKRIQPLLSLVDREVEFCGAFYMPTV